MNFDREKEGGKSVTTFVIQISSSSFFAPGRLALTLALCFTPSCHTHYNGKGKKNRQNDFMLELFEK